MTCNRLVWVLRCTAHTCAQVSDMLLGGKDLAFYQYGDDVNTLLDKVGWEKVGQTSVKHRVCVCEWFHYHECATGTACSWFLTCVASLYIWCVFSV